MHDQLKSLEHSQVNTFMLIMNNFVPTFTKTFDSFLGNFALHHVKEIPPLNHSKTVNNTVC